MKKLLISVIGNRNSGKSTTWNTLFKRTVKTGTKLKLLEIYPGKFLKVFLVSGSPQERKKLIEEIMCIEEPIIVLCSIQYTPDAVNTFNYFLERSYKIYCQWLNPGYDDAFEFAKTDDLELLDFLLDNQAIISIENGKIDASERVGLIRSFLYGWGTEHNLI
jgi:hypothetical protein